MICHFSYLVQVIGPHCGMVQRFAYSGVALPNFVVNSWPEGGKLARLRYLQRLLPRTLLPLLLRCRFDLLRLWANICLLSIKHTFVCSASLLKRFTLRAVTAADSFLNVTADMARDFVFGFRSLISMRSFVAAASSFSTAKSFVPQ